MGLNCELYNAALAGNERRLQRLLEKPQASPNAMHNTSSLLLGAVKSGNERAVELLIRAGANLELRCGNGYTALLGAIQFKELGALNALLAAGADACVVAGDGRMALHAACIYPDEEVMGRLLEYFTTSYFEEHINKKDDFGRTPLFHACDRGFGYGVEALLERKADASLAEGEGFTPLHVAVMMGRKDLASMLLAKGADIHAVCRARTTPLYRACEKGDPNMVELLLTAGAWDDVNVRAGPEVDEMTPLEAATSFGHNEVVKILSESTAELNKPNTGFDGFSPLHHAMTVEVVRELLNAGADVNARDNDGSTALHIAAAKGLPFNVLIALVEGGADPAALNDEGHSPAKAAYDNDEQLTADLLTTLVARRMEEIELLAKYKAEHQREKKAKRSCS